MSRPPEQPELGWAVHLTSQELDRRHAQRDRFHQLATGKSLFLAVLTAWNLLGLVYLIGGLLSAGPVRPMVLSTVIWIWLFGDTAIVTISYLIRRFNNGRPSAA
jgi:hypothetical protein